MDVVGHQPEARHDGTNVEQLLCKVDVNGGMAVATLSAIMEPKKDAQGDTTGEGNYDASRRYREGLEQSVKKGDANELGEKAKKALEGSEGDALRKAEEEAKRGGGTPKRT
jgi:hypothetical protein